MVVDAAARLLLAAAVGWAACHSLGSPIWNRPELERITLGKGIQRTDYICVCNCVYILGLKSTLVQARQYVQFIYYRGELSDVSGRPPHRSLQLLGRGERVRSCSL